MDTISLLYLRPFSCLSSLHRDVLALAEILKRCHHHRYDTDWAMHALATGSYHHQDLIHSYYIHVAIAIDCIRLWAFLWPV